MANNQNVHIRPDLKVGKLAKLALETYFRNPDPAEIARLQDGEYGHRTFIINSTMPIVKRADEIDNAPEGRQTGGYDFYRQHYWAMQYDIGGVKYRVVNDWKESPNPRDNRTPLEDWIRRMGLSL